MVNQFGGLGLKIFCRIQDKLTYETTTVLFYQDIGTFEELIIQW